MSTDENDKRIKGIDKARKSTSIKQVESVEDVAGVQKTGRVGSVGRSTAATGTGAAKQMSFEDREKLLSMVEEEAKKIFGKSNIPESKKAVIKRAVEMAIDAAIVPDSDSGSKSIASKSDKSD